MRILSKDFGKSVDVDLVEDFKSVSFRGKLFHSQINQDAIPDPDINPF